MQNLVHKTIALFFSYAREDESLRDKLATHLTVDGAAGNYSELERSPNPTRHRLARPSCPSTGNGPDYFAAD